MKSFQRVLHGLSFDPVLARLFARAPWEEVARLADWLASADPYREKEALGRALHAAGASASDHRPHLEHQLWCAWREAAWQTGLAGPLPLVVEGASWLAETVGHPTIIVAPMTLSTTDAMQAIVDLDPGRPCIVFGEGVGTQEGDRPEVVSEGSATPVRRILEVLERGGLFLTYPDFVYGGRAAETIELFGRQRPVSSGFVSLAARDDTMLLPAICLHTGNALRVRIEEPLHVRSEGIEASTDAAARQRITRSIGEMLESLIRIAPEQWRLLPTLTFESPQMGRSIQ